MALTSALLLVFLNGFFVAAECALVKIQPSKIQELLENQSPGAQALRDAVNNLDGYLSATQLGITLASLGLGWLGGSAFMDPLICSGPSLRGILRIRKEALDPKNEVSDPRNSNVSNTS